ncbi:MAG: Insecticidal toxin complex protein [Xanthomarina sp.]|mgnify:CR=1 FL=1|nr:Insecticidal toxin complex protein [Xanthomarina sp.]MAL22659.1 Insecticidal toxin complex protein [Xanthomarina sp.]MBF62478.1 Insecticidal toxin complex protein [Xanthomarina sp.]HAB28355.1 Insecticidal toxin complex protein [Xanthomarina gelatinilytica]HAI18805.1 Insecticidal toxin complex protein [Xanthomarina gelatinilytica]|tara:strand:+ start:718 stop:1422 length:705 start_codon:yes stop_codon:yes gene_type:complete
MRHFFILLCFFSTLNSHSKEWNCLKTYQSQTGNTELQASDWLRKDRKNNTLVWQQANVYNLKHNLSSEYQTIKQRTDFYLWLNKALNEKKMDVVWPKMAHFISNKLEKIKSFPFSIFTGNEVKHYAEKGSETVFMKAFETVRELYFSDSVLQSDEALTWDENIIYQEQYVWLDEIYKEVDARTLKTIDKMAKGKCIYTFMVPKEVAFTGDLSNKENRYDYALNTLRVYCKTEYQ